MIKSLWPLLLCAASLQAAEPAKETTPVGRQFEAMMDEYRAGVELSNNAKKAAKTDAEREAAQKLFPDRPALAARLAKLAADNPDDPESINVLCRLLHAFHGIVYSNLVTLPDLRKIEEKAENPKWKAIAAFTRAERLKSQAERDPKSVPEADVINAFRHIEEKYEDRIWSRGRSYGYIARQWLREIETLSPGNEAPETEGTDVYGERFKLSDYRGNVVLLLFSNFKYDNFKQQRELVKKLDGKPFVLLGINGGSLDDMLEAIAIERVTWRCWQDGRSFSGKLWKKWNINSYPTQILIDHKGTIRGKGQSLDESIITQLLQELDVDPNAPKVDPAKTQQPTPKKNELEF